MQQRSRRRPFLGNLKAQRRNARLRQLLKAGIIKPMSKAEMRLTIERIECGCTRQVVSKPFCEHDKP